MPGNLIYYALVLIVITLVAALFGFGGVASTAMGGAGLLIWVAVVIVVVGVVFALITSSITAARTRLTGINWRGSQARSKVFRWGTNHQIWIPAPHCRWVTTDEGSGNLGAFIRDSKCQQFHISLCWAIS